MAAPRHEFIGIVHMRTPKAILFQCWYWHVPLWMPISQCWITPQPDTDEIVVSASSWICGKNNVVEFEERHPDEEETPDG